MSSDSPGEPDIRKKRIATLVGAFDLLTSFHEIQQNTRLDTNLVVRVVEEYLRERALLTERNKIPGRIQRHKIAGIMAASIVRNRPIQIVNDKSPSGVQNSFDNEYLAILHGVAVCAEGVNNDKLLSLLKHSHFSNWVEDTVHLLRYGSHSEMTCIHVFHTLSLGFFPENLNHDTPPT